ncbi:MAG: SUMF1/EgtB/PvdO family nonheme iron enzyme [Minicystis sp.]
MIVATAALALTSMQCEQLINLDDFYNCPEDPRCPSCSDGKKNGGETDVDCGGACPSKCAAGGACSTAGDCASGACTDGECQASPGPSCSDGEKNGNETDKDCGGGACPACPVGGGCDVGTDCESLACGSGHVCLAPRCDDMVKNGDETDTDCGGSCAPCAYGKHCAQNEDCTNAVCNAGSCTGECTPGLKQCSGLDAQTCDANGIWQTTEACAYVCEAGACTGVCSPGAKQCTGSTPEICDASGQWQSGTVCSGVELCSAGTCVMPLSCQAGVTGAGLDCGPSSNESCCTSLPVTGGTFYRSYDGVTTTPMDYTSKAYPATVSTFKLDKYEVTVGRFRRFVSAWLGGWRPAAGAGKHVNLNAGSGLANSASPGTYETGWDTAWEANLAATASAWNTNLACPTSPTWTSSAGSNEKRPVNCVTWYEAYAFCIWDGGYLPSEAEWNYAAAGGDEQRVYPWGSTVPGSNANLAIYGCYYNGNGNCTGVGNIAPVGTVAAGDGRYGQADLAGNVWEWTLDRYTNYVSPCVDCAYQVAGGGSTFRGGSYANDKATVLGASRGSGIGPTYRLPNIGARCARVD